MKQRKRDTALVIIMAIFLCGLSLWCWIKKPEAYSDSERRVLASVPKLRAAAFFSGDLMEDFESYVTDQFPVRDTFRSIKAITELGILKKRDNNDFYVHNGQVSRLEYPLQEKMLTYAADRFRFLYDSYLADKEMKLYFAVVPDKNYYMARQSGRLSLDYEKLISFLREKTDYMEYVDITGALSPEDYYRTDTHWKQENLTDVVAVLADAMGVTLSETYEEHVLEKPFYGVYAGQSALPLAPDTIRYLTNKTLEACVVTSYDTGKPVAKAVYDMEKAAGRDPYEMFLSGSDALLVIENPSAKIQRELIVFRDSFASSLIPLLVEGYSKITLVDIRYVQSSQLDHFLEFQDQEVLFLYSTLLLNNSLALK